MKWERQRERLERKGLKRKATVIKGEKKREYRKEERRESHEDKKWKGELER